MLYDFIEKIIEFFITIPTNPNYLDMKQNPLIKKILHNNNNN